MLFRSIGSIPTDTPEQQARVAKIQQMTPNKNAPMAVFLTSDRAAGVSGQVFALFVIAVAAAEVGVGLAIVLAIFRNFRTVDIDHVDLMKG